MAMRKAPKLNQEGIFPEKGSMGQAFIENGVLGITSGVTAPPKKETPPAPSVESGSQVVAEAVSEVKNGEEVSKMPWEESSINPMKEAPFLLRMKEPLKVKINFVLDSIPGRISMQKYIMGLIESDIEQKLKQLNG